MRAKALALIDQYIKSQGLKKHMLAVEGLMRALARKFREDEDQWGLAGLVHDLDWEMTRDDSKRHSLVAAEILEREGFPVEVLRAVKVHNHLHGAKPQTRLEKALYSCEEITGLIAACALVRPSRKLADVMVDSVLKKFKEKSFAAGVNRDIILECEPMLGMKLEELAAIALKAMQQISDELGL